MNEKGVLVDLFYLPPIEFFVAVLDYETIWIEKQDNYQKQSYRNRTAVQLANTVKYLSIPVRGGNKKNKYASIQVDDDQRWRDIHLRGLQSAYGKAPFFEYIYPEIEAVFLGPVKGLYAFNRELLTFCLRFIGNPARLEETSEYRPCWEVNDLRGVLKAKESYKYRNIYAPYPYNQIFGVNFVPNLSIIDLLFCEGPNSMEVIRRSKKKLNIS